MLTRIFKSGNLQAVRIPKDLNFDSDIQVVDIERKNDALVIRPHASARWPDSWIALPPSRRISWRRGGNSIQNVSVERHNAVHAG